MAKKKETKAKEIDYDRPVDPSLVEGLTEEADWNFDGTFEKLQDEFKASNPELHKLLKAHADKKTT